MCRRTFSTPFQKETLEKCALRFLQPSETETALFCNLFDEGGEIQPHEKHAEYRFRALLGFSILTLHRIHGGDLRPTAATQNQMPPLMLKVIDHFNTHYDEKQSLDELAEHFFVSKATLIYNFNKYASCSPMDFLLNVRLTKAKDLLINSDHSVGEISDKCGFSSANYFGLIFKKKEGLSPLQYRKNQRSKV